MKTGKIGIICDIHLPGEKDSPQYAFLKMAIERMKADGIEMVLCLGDVTRFGELAAWELYLDAMKGFAHYQVLGNSDVRDPKTIDAMLAYGIPVKLALGKRTLFGIHTPYGVIEPEDREFLQEAKHGDVLFLHHYPATLEAESRMWLTSLAEQKALTILCGHGHRSMDLTLGKSRVWVLKCLDPDKAIGNFPCIYYLVMDEAEVHLEEHILKLPLSGFSDMADYFGISCVDNQGDVSYAIRHRVRNVELRCNGNWTREPADVSLISEWRAAGGEYLSVHMPNLDCRSGVLKGAEQWAEALDFALEVKADGFTMHPPRVSVSKMIPGSELWNELKQFYLMVAARVPENVSLGIENLHKGSGEALDENRGFGYIPEEVSAWIDTLNKELGENRFGHVLDVGHARNNGVYAQLYPVSGWYTRMGKKTVAYHIHQVKSSDAGMKNHNAIEDWFGPVINYSGFWYAWSEGILNHVPVFLEVKGWESFEKSVKAFEQIIK